MSLTERYADWTGTLDDLWRELVTVSRELSDDPDLPTQRGIRHYQSEGAVDRAGSGRGARYTRRHLFQVLATRTLLAEGWKLARIPDVTRVLPDDQLEALARGRTDIETGRRGLQDDDPQDARAQARAGVRALRAGTDGLPSGVSRLVYQTEAARPQHRQAASCQIAASAAAPSESSPQTAGRRSLAYTPADWVSASVDPAALADLTDREIDTALEELSRNLKSDRRTLKTRKDADS